MNIKRWVMGALVGTLTAVAGRGADALLTGSSPVALAIEHKYRVEVPGLILQLDDEGRIAGGSTMDLSGQTQIGGCRTLDKAPAEKLPGNGYAFTRKLGDAQGHTCTVLDRFTPDKESIRWEVEITSTDAFWSAPIVSRLQCGRPTEKLFWTAWGSPDCSGTQLTPELSALVQAGKASVSGAWSDPLMPVGFLNRNWHYGNAAQAEPVGGDYVVLPLFTVLSPASDTGLSLVLSPDDTLLALDLAVSGDGQFQYTRTNHRLGGGKTVKFTLHLVPHEASWRGGLRFLTGRYPQYFEAPNPRAHKLAGCGAYSICEAPIDVAKFRKMAFGFNWKLSDDFPYMGMFLPPVTRPDEQWTRSCDEPCPPGKGPTTSASQMNSYAKTMQESGFAVFSYFNVTEFGKNMYGRKAVMQASDPELWKDPVAYLKYRLPNAVFDPSIKTCYKAYIVDPGDPDYLNFMLEQGRRNIQWLPNTDGICIDRTDWLRFYNKTADDGVSWIDGKPARSLYRSWADIMARLGPLMHGADKVIFCNIMAMRLEVSKELDGIYSEHANNGKCLNGVALIGLRKPVVAWSYNKTLHEPDPDSFMQRHLHLGVFPTAPYPTNNHCINPSPEADQLYSDYGPLLAAMRGRKWVLNAHCLACDGAKANLFEVPGGYVIPVTFGGTNPAATLTVQNVQGLTSGSRFEALYPGDERPVAVPSTFASGKLTVAVPLKRGCAMIKVRVDASAAPSR